MSNLLRLLLSTFVAWSFVPAQNAQTLAPAVVRVDGPTAIDLGWPVQFTAVITGSTDNVSYEWRKNGTTIAGTTTAVFRIAAAAAADAGTYSITVPQSAGSSSATIALTVLPSSPPVIGIPPRSRSVPLGDTVTFDIFTGGSAPQMFQWRKDGVAIPGATAGLYRIAAVAASDAGAYSVVVTNPFGSVTSAGATLTVAPAVVPVFANGFPRDVTVAEGGSAQFAAGLTAGSQPLTYQWSKAGTIISGATGSTLDFPVARASDAGRYSVVVTNLVGTATSREATLTLTPAVPVSITQQPQSRTIFQGQPATFAVAVAGSAPLAYQWRKNGTSIAGATFASYSLSAATLADAGEYSVAVTNFAGSATSSNAALIVNPAVPVVITVHPTGGTFAFGTTISLAAQFTGSEPFTMRWEKDGAPLPSAGTSSQFYLSDLKPSDSGSYTLVVSNPAGTVRTQPAVVVVRSAALPLVTRQPASAGAPVGTPVSFSAEYTAVGTGGLPTLQWHKNGFPIAGATTSTLTLPEVKESDAGDYALVLTVTAGPTSSAPARLTVLPAVAPRIAGGPNAEAATPHYRTSGGEGILDPGPVDGSKSIALQWFRDGVAIPGATRDIYVMGTATDEHAGTYVLVATNDGGVTASNPRVFRPAPTQPWVDVTRAGDVLYFLATTPPRIERYDLVAERWLATTTYLDAADTHGDLGRAGGRLRGFRPHARAPLARPLDRHDARDGDDRHHAALHRRRPPLLQLAHSVRGADLQHHFAHDAPARAADRWFRPRLSTPRGRAELTPGFYSQRRKARPRHRGPVRGAGAPAPYARVSWRIEGVHLAG